MSYPTKTPEAFMEYFRTNYPGPNTIIARPDWHAPKIYAAAVSASGHSELLASARSTLEAIESWHHFHGHEEETGIHCDDICARIPPLRAAIEKAEARA